MKCVVSPSPCDPIPSPNRWFGAMPIWVKRDDLMHPQISGNKFRKLKYALPGMANTITTKAQALVTMGGLWSNHVHASAYAAHLHGMSSLALIRAAPQMNSAMLDDCRAWGMQLCFVEREHYRALRATPNAWRAYVPQDFVDPIWLPEGGSAPAALHGVAELIAELPFLPDNVVVACGSGATLAGLLAGLHGRSHVLGIAVFKNADYLHGEVARLLREADYPAYDNYTLLTDFHHGGYAKAPPALREFCAAFEADTQVPVEPVYTGKLFYALHSLAYSGALSGSVVAVHTGGLQGARGFI